MTDRAQTLASTAADLAEAVNAKPPVAASKLPLVSCLGEDLGALIDPATAWLLATAEAPTADLFRSAHTAFETLRYPLFEDGRQEAA